MTNELTKDDIKDLDIVEEEELASEGLTGSPFSTSLIILSIAAVTKTIVLSSGDFNEPRSSEFDIIKIKSGDALGNYTIDEVIDDITAKVKETIPDATNGEAEIYYRAGTETVGFKNDILNWPLSKNTTQKAIEYVKTNAQLPIVVSYNTLPSSPLLNQHIFYVPFNSVLRWDGTHWVGPKQFWRFGRNRQGTFPIWLRGDDVSMSPRIILGTTYVFGDYLPEFTANNSSIRWKVYNITAKSDKDVTGDMELHASSGLLIPNYVSTGKGKTIFNNEKYSDTELTTPTLLESHARLQMYFRRTAGTWNELKSTITVACVATGAT